jgi:transcriptional regulator with XRE-family HTH domain
LRVAAGLSTTQLAERLSWSQPKVSRIETATHGVAPGDVRTWAEELEAPAAQVEQLVELAWMASIEVRTTMNWLRSAINEARNEPDRRYVITKKVTDPVVAAAFAQFVADDEQLGYVPADLIPEV